MLLINTNSLYYRYKFTTKHVGVQSMHLNIDKNAGIPCTCIGNYVHDDFSGYALCMYATLVHTRVLDYDV